MTSDQPSPNSTPEQPDARTAVPMDGQPATGQRETTPVANGASDAPQLREITVRRAPKFVPFMALGAIVGFLAAFVVAYTGPADPTLTRESVLGFFTVAFALPGLLLAALLALVFDRRSIKRTERARAERTYDDDAA